MVDKKSYLLCTHVETILTYSYSVGTNLLNAKENVLLPCNWLSWKIQQVQETSGCNKTFNCRRW